MPWTIERLGAPASRITLPVLRGTVTPEELQDDAVSVGLDGTVTVWSSPPQPVTPSIPVCHFAPKRKVDLLRLRGLVQSRAVCLLTADDGSTYRVKCIGSWAPILQDTTGRLVKPHWEVQLKFQGV